MVTLPDPRDAFRGSFAARHQLPSQMVFADWCEFVAHPKLCDALVIAPMDRVHIEPAVARLKKGYHVFREKPKATTLEDYRAIECTRRKTGGIVGACHSLRHHKAFGLPKELVTRYRIGRVTTPDQIEQVARWY